MAGMLWMGGQSESGEMGAVTILQERKKQASKSNVQDILADLKACSRTRNMGRGKQVHAEAVESGYGSSIFVATELIRMYAKCGSMMDALEVFDSMKHPDVVSCTALILGYAENGQGHNAFDMFTRMRIEGIAPDTVTFVGALKACTALALTGGMECRDCGKIIHNLALESGCSSHIYVQNTLLGMYAKSGCMGHAREVFDIIKQPDVVSWNVVILGYADNGQGLIALSMLFRMIGEGHVPDSLTLTAALKACTSLAVEGGASRWTECRDAGNRIRNIVFENGCSSHIYVQNTLIDMYAKCGCMVSSREVFESVKHRDVVSWNALILGYADNGEGQTALDMFIRMTTEDPAPDSVTFVASLKACTSIAVKYGASQWEGCRENGRRIYNFAVEIGWNSHSVRNTLLDMYTKCGSMVDAHEVFDSLQYPSVVSWTVLILGYANNGQGRSALELFSRMKLEGPAPDSVTFVAVIKACASLAVEEGASKWTDYKKQGRELYNLAMNNCCNSDLYMKSALVDLYAKCGSMVDAREVFDSIKNPDVMCWNMLILGYAHNGEGHIALDVFISMRGRGAAPNTLTFMAALKACGLVGALEFGIAIHSELEIGNDSDVALVTCLVEFYTKCGSMVEAQKVFNSHSQKTDLITWNALLAGFSSCGDKEAVFELFEGLQNAGFRPDGVTFLCILSCCSHVGLVEKGKECFNVMSTKYGIIPTVEHYTCMIDLFGRTNKLDDAMALLIRMPFNADIVTWKTVLGACWKWKNVEIGRLAFQSLLHLNYRDAVGFVLMAQIYGSRGMMLEQEMVMELKNKLIK